METFWKERFLREISLSGKYSEQILKAFLRVPREIFCEYQYDLAEIYSDTVLITARDGNDYTTSSQPSLMALFMQAGCLKSGMKVLEIGSGTGYNACVMAEIVAEDGLVVGTELNKKFCDLAIRNVERLGIKNVIFLNKDGFDGVSEYAPFNAIIVTVAVDRIPNQWLNQLEEDGRIVAPIDIYTVDSQPAVVFVKKTNEILCQEVVETRFLKAKGKLGALNDINIAKLNELRKKHLIEREYHLYFSHELLRILHISLWSLCEEYGKIYHVEESGYAILSHNLITFGEVKDLEKVLESWKILEYPSLRDIKIIYDETFKFKQLQIRKGNEL